MSWKMRGCESDRHLNVRQLNSVGMKSVKFDTDVQVKMFQLTEHEEMKWDWRGLVILLMISKLSIKAQKETTEGTAMTTR